MKRRIDVVAPPLVDGAGAEAGGFGEGVVAYYSERNIDADVTVFAFDEKPYPQGSVEFIMKKTATDPTSLAEKIYAKVKA